MKRVLVTILLLFAIMALPVAADEYEKIGDVQTFFLNQVGMSDLSFRELPNEYVFNNMHFTKVLYKEPSNPKEKFVVRYFDDGGYYCFQIASKSPYVGFMHFNSNTWDFEINSNEKNCVLLDYLKMIRDNDDFVSTKATRYTATNDIFGYVYKTLPTHYVTFRLKPVT